MSTSSGAENKVSLEKKKTKHYVLRTNNDPKTNVECKTKYLQCFFSMASTPHSMIFLKAFRYWLFQDVATSGQSIIVFYHHFRDVSMTTASALL